MQNNLILPPQEESWINIPGDIFILIQEVIKMLFKLSLNQFWDPS